MKKSKEERATEDVVMLRGKLESVRKPDRVYAKNWTVAKLRHYPMGPQREIRQVVSTLTGPLVQFNTGDIIEAYGRFEKHERYGDQFVVISAQIAPTAKIAELKRWFAATLPHIDNKRVEHLFAKLGPDVAKSLDDPDALDRLIALDGITEGRAFEILEAWQAARQWHSTFKAYVEYGLNAQEIDDAVQAKLSIEEISNDPFALYYVAKVSIARVEHLATLLNPELIGSTAHRAAQIHVMLCEQMDNGDTALPVDVVLKRMKDLRFHGVTAERLITIVESQPARLAHYGNTIAPARLALCEAVIAQFVRARSDREAGT